MTILLLSPCLAFALVHMIGIGRWLRFKPFTCETCMGGWLAGALAVVDKPWWEVPFWMGAGMVATALLTAWMKKI